MRERGIVFITTSYIKLLSTITKSTMHNKLKTKWIILLSLLFVATSCIDEDLSECPSGLSVGFTYNLYNQDMEHANAFENVESDMTLMVFDNEGTLVNKYVATSDDLKHNAYQIDVCCLPSGSYQLLAWGGIANGSFIADNLVEGSSKLDDVLVSLSTIQQGVSSKNLVPLFYGMGSLDNYKTTKYTKVEIPLVKNTNTFRILLQDVSGAELNPNLFSFEIIDSNIALNYKNEVATNLKVSYTPFAQGNVSIDTKNDGENEEVKAVVFAELSTSKLFANHSKSARLRVINSESGVEVMNIPLIDMVLMMKNEKFSASISNQTYLDRIHNFYMTFYMHNGSWVKSQIIVNDWVLRFNEIEDF